MESNVIIAVVVGLIIGAVVVYFIKLKLQKEDVLPTTNVNDSKYKAMQSNVEALEKEKEILQKKLADSAKLSDLEDLEIEKKNLQKKLADSEQLLLTVQENNSGNTSDGVDKLLKEIKKLKDDIDDLENDLGDEGKKNKKLRAEKTEIEEERDAVEKEKESLVEEKETLEKSLETTKKEAEEDKESLTFIKAILAAENSSNKDFEKLDNDTYGIYFFIRNKIAHYFEHPDYIDNYAWEWRNSELKPWIKDKKKIAIVGEFSAGKTSIINRILSQDNPNVSLLPVSSKETTAIPTYVSKSLDFNCQYYSPDDELKNIKKETFEMVTKSVLDKVNVSHLIKYFVLSYDNQYLDNISILDTPGFASNSDEIIKKTTDVVKEADALFWVIDANTGDINQTSIDVMKNHLSDIPLYFIINKSDTKSPGELNQLEEKIKKTATANDIQYKVVIRFSQKENVEVLMKHIQEIEIQEQEPLMKHIANTLEEIIKGLKDDKKALSENRKVSNNNLNITEGNFKTIEGDIKFSAENIKRLVKEKDNFFTGTKYQIDKTDYTDFQDNVSKIINLSEEIQKEVYSYSEDIKTKIKIDAAFEENKHHLKEMEQIKKDFIKIITDYNKNLLN